MIKVKFLPLNTTPFLQPMDQQFIASFKKMCTKALLQMCFEEIRNTIPTLRKFWKYYFNILNCLYLIYEIVLMVRSYSEEPEFCMAKKSLLLPQPVDPRVQLVDDIVSTGQTLFLEVDHADVQELVQDHKEKLTTDELLELHKEQQQNVAEKAFVSGIGDTGG